MLKQKPDFTKLKPVKKEVDPPRYPNISNSYEGEFKNNYSHMLGTMTAMILKELKG